MDLIIAKLKLQVACFALIFIPLFLLFFHALIIAGILPRNIVWDGRLTDQTFIPLELSAIAINLLLMLTGGVAGKYIRSPIALTIVDRIKWFLFYFVVVNTVLALFSATTFELLLTPITALFALSLYRINKFSDGFGRVSLLLTEHHRTQR